MRSGGADEGHRPRFRFAIFAPCFPRAVRVFFGNLEIVFLRFAARAAFFTFLRAAAFCLDVATVMFLGSGFYCRELQLEYRQGTALVRLPLEREWGLMPSRIRARRGRARQP